MSQSTPLTRFVRRHTTDVLMFGFVQGVQAALPSVGVDKALELYRKAMRVPQEEWNGPSQRVKYQRMLGEYFEDQREDHGK